MRLINSSFEILEQPSGIGGIHKMIEIAGRTCYKSEDKITEDSAKDFVSRMVKSGHGAMLEHGTVYLEAYGPWDITTDYMVDKYINNPYSKVVGPIYDKSNDFNNRPYSKAYITTNLRVLIENEWLSDLQTKIKYNHCFLCEPTKYHEKRVSVRFICDRGVSHEFVRHRVFSFAQESTRYCNYSKDKFNNELTFIEPVWFKGADNHIRLIFLDCLNRAEGLYLDLLKGTSWVKKVIEEGANHEKFEFVEKSFSSLTPQQARQVLPNALKTELVMTGFISDWKHFFKLRCAESAHPDVRKLALGLQEEFLKRGYIESKVEQ